MTACFGWTAHELTAHLAAGAAEMALTLEAYSEGRPVPPTRGFEEREAPYRRIEDAELRLSLLAAFERETASLEAVLAAEPSAVVPWTGRDVPVAAFVTHAGSELALHRWDLVGDDPTSVQLLSQPEFTAHAVFALGRVLAARGALLPADLRIVLRSAGAPDVLLVGDEAGTRLEFAHDGDHDAPIAADADARLLLLWGRRPSDPGRVRVPGGAELLAQVQSVLAGY